MNTKKQATQNLIQNTMLHQNIPKQHRIYLKLSDSIELYEITILFYLKGKASSRS